MPPRRIVSVAEVTSTHTQSAWSHKPASSQHPHTRAPISTNPYHAHALSQIWRVEGAPPTQASTQKFVLFQTPQAQICYTQICSNRAHSQVCITRVPTHLGTRTHKSVPRKIRITTTHSRKSVTYKYRHTVESTHISIALAPTRSSTPQAQICHTQICSTRSHSRKSVTPTGTHARKHPHANLYYASAHTHKSGSHTSGSHTSGSHTHKSVTRKSVSRALAHANS